MSSQIVSKGIGIDLGTTNSAVAVMNPTDTEILIHKDPISKSATTPSCIWKNPRNGEIIVGRKALRRIGMIPPPIQSVKRLMGKRTNVLMTDEEVTPEQVSAYILGEMKQQIEDDVRQFGTDTTSWIVDRGIITVPAYFDQPSIDATRRAGELIGIEVLDLLHEPTAAACYHCWRTGTQNGTFLVYDLGGGTFDVTILRVTAGTFDVLGISGNNRLGGDDIDVVLAEHLQQILLREGYALDLDVTNIVEDRLRFETLKFLAEGMKKALSTSSEFVLRDTGSLKDQDGTPVIIEMMFERPEVEALIEPIVARTIPYCQEALERAEKKSGVRISDLDAVILAGGSTHIPLVREMVRKSFCADDMIKEPRAKCAEPVYDQVDTLVAFGAAIRAAAIGGLAVYNPERTVRVSFRGTASTDAKQTHVGGKVEVLRPGIDLSSGRVHLTITDMDFEDDSELHEGGVFGFKRVPLQSSSENMLSFEVFDDSDRLVAVAGRPLSQSKGTARPTGGSGSTAILSKAILMEVSRGGQTNQRELIPALTTLPTNEDFNFAHPGHTELIRLPLLQGKTKIQEIKVPVASSLPKGTPIELNLNIDELSFITVKGKIGDTTFDAVLDLPPDRTMPSDEDIIALDHAFSEAVEYLVPGKKAVSKAKYKTAKHSFEAALKRSNKEQAIHDFEEMEELVADLARTEGPVQPPREFFEELVEECQEINRYVAQTAAEAGQPHDHRELQKSIDFQRVQGEKAFAAGDQKAYSDAIMLLESIKNHLIALAQKVMPVPPPISEQERAAAMGEVAEREANKLGQFAASQQRKDLQEEAELIKKKLGELAREAQKNPKAVQEKISMLRARLEQMKNVLMGRREDKDRGSLVEDYDQY